MNILFIKSLVKFCHIVLCSHLPLHIDEVVPEPLLLLIFFPNISVNGKNQMKKCKVILLYSKKEEVKRDMQKSLKDVTLSPP